MMNDITRYWIGKFNLDNISEIDNIEKLSLKNLKDLKEVSFQEELGSRRDVGYEANNLENIDIISEDLFNQADLLKSFKTQDSLFKFLNVNYFLLEILKKLIK